MDEETTVRPRQSVNFMEQLQAQIQLCREAISNIEKPVNPVVDALEGLVWAKIRKDVEYKKTNEKLDQWYNEKTKNLKDYGDDADRLVFYQKSKAKERFKALMVFIDQQGWLPIGND